MFSPKPLKASFGDYSPAISAEIMEVHYTKHYFGYVNNLNNALSKYPEGFQLEIPQILSKIEEIPEEIKTAVRNNGGGAINHEILGETLSTKPKQVHDGELKSNVEKVFGSGEEFINKFSSASISLFGSGGTGLVIDNKTKELKIMATPNQDSPYMFDCYPVFGIDVGEHAYYLQYKNVRKDYLENILSIIDGKAVEERFLKAK